MFDALRYLNDFGIQCWENHPKASVGWITIYCPFCANPNGPRGGFAPEGFFSCWRCGGHRLEDVIMALERIPYHEACKRLDDYENPSLIAKKQEFVPAPAMIFPIGIDKLQYYHKIYLAKRGYDVAYIEQKYKISATGLVGFIMNGKRKLDYSLRIIIPVFIDNKIVSWQGRDVTGKSSVKYKACPTQFEIMHHKHVLYNIDNCKGNRAVVVEGCLDVWRMGDGCCGTFGSSFTWPQVDMLAKRFEHIFIMYDPETEAQIKARKIMNALIALGRNAELIKLDKGDPGEMDQLDANNLMKELLG